MKLLRTGFPLVGLLAAVLAGGTAYAVEQGETAADGPRKAEVTRADAQAQASRMFARLDVNHDGKLDPADRAAQQTAMFDSMDTDKNGQISRAEFAAHHPGGHDMAGGEAMRAGAGERRGHKMGQGPMAEGRMGHGGGHRMGQGRDRAMMMMRVADTNKDNAVSEAEFTAAGTAMFDRADTNNDGKVSREERRNGRMAMRQMMRGSMPPAGN